MRHPKAALGRLLFRLCNRFPAAKPKLCAWGMRTAGERFGDRVGNIQLPDGRSFKLASISEDYLSFELFWRGGGYYEPITRLLIQEIVRPGDTFIDVGANVGFYTLVVASRCPETNVISFEPNPGNFALLTKNVRANALRNVRCEPLAVSDEDRTATLYLTGSHMSASLRAGFDGNVTGTTEVKTVRLDTYLAPYPADARLVMKVDVEGHEEALFRGMHATLARLSPDIITEVTFSYSRDAVDQLTRCGYHFFQITDQGLIASPALVPVVRGRFVFLNYLMTKKNGAEVEAVFNRMRPAVRKIDLTKTSKCLGPADLERFIRRAAEDSPNPNVEQPSSDDLRQLNPVVSNLQAS
jgi:FkbM family methyltransferase